MLRGHESCIGGGFDRPAKPTAAAARESGVAADRLPDLADIAEAEDAGSQSAAGDVASGRSSILFLPLLLLLSGQHQQLGIGRQHLAEGILELPPRLHPPTYLLDPVLGDVLDTLFPLNHKRQRPDLMTSALDAMAGGFAAAKMGAGERAREGLWRDMETVYQLELALTQSRSERSSGPVNHLIVLLP